MANLTRIILQNQISKSAEKESLFSKERERTAHKVKYVTNSESTSSELQSLCAPGFDPQPNPGLPKVNCKLSRREPRVHRGTELSGGGPRCQDRKLQ